MEKIIAAGTFLQFFISNKAITSLILPQILKLDTKYGTNTIDKGKKVIDRATFHAMFADQR